MIIAYVVGQTCEAAALRCVVSTGEQDAEDLPQLYVAMGFIERRPA